MLTLKCGKCGREYKQSFYDLTKKDKKHMYCNKCNKKERSKKRKMSKEKFLKMFTDNNLTVLPNQEFVYGKRIEVVDNEGYRGFTSYGDLKSGKHFCQFAMKGNTEENFIYNINLWCKNNNIKSKAICFSENQIHKNKTILFQCECGNEFETTKISFVYGKCRCDKCTKRISRYEYKVKNYLEEINEDFIYQFKINSCRDILPLPFDFQLKKYNALIEVDGEGHEKPCNFNQISNDDAIKTYLITKKHDKIKNDYCTKYNIPLLRISYKDINNSENYKQIINDFINKL
jgi:very-short-patch-repair endonuclease